ncbi:MAG: RBBP9/YdeN family alpha/beta hydrolase [Nanoarchaeota archaeon]
MKNVIIVHGSCFHDKEKLESGEPKINKRAWLPWIKQELEKQDISCEVPLMPNNSCPNYEKWKTEFERLKINEETILIGHSLGCAFLVRWLGETERKIEKLILVAPAVICPDFYEQCYKDFYNFKISDKIKDNVGDIIIFISNDREEIIESADIFKEKLEGKNIKLKNLGHFTEEDMGTTEFPELLEEILK